MDDLPLRKVAISGPTLASLTHRISSSLGDVDGLLFGHVGHSSSPTLSDDLGSSSPQLIATITSFLCPTSSPLSFHNALGHLLPNLNHFLSSQNHPLLGWFSFRRRAPPRLSMREFFASHSLSTNSPNPNHDSSSLSDHIKVAPCVFLLFSTPLQDQIIHTHEYRAYQYRPSALSFDPKSIDVVNIGPAFRGHYGSLSPSNSGFFPGLSCDLRGSSVMNEDTEEEAAKSLVEMKERSEVVAFTQGFRVGDLKRLVGPEASDYTRRLEELYEKMLDKVETLARQVEQSNAKVLEQETRNRKLRYRIARGGHE